MTEPQPYPTPAVQQFARWAWGGAVRAARGLRWYVTTLMGDRDYERYVAHLRHTHPDREPLTERAYWRERMDDQDRNPGARCC